MSEGRIDGEGSLIARKRLVAMIAMFVVMIVSSLLILFFILNFELKKDHNADASLTISADVSADLPVPSFTFEPIEIPSPDLTEQRREALVIELAELLSMTTSSVEAAGDGEVTWIYDKTTPRAVMSVNFYVYIGKKGGATWCRLRVGCILDEPLYSDQIVVNVEGCNYAIDIQYNDLKHEELGHIGSTYEYADLPVEGHSALLHHIGNARDIYVCFKNGGNERHFQLTREQAEAVGRIVRIADIQAELDEDDRRREYYSDSMPK